MRYFPNLRARTCRFGPVVAERKLVRTCVFCGRSRPYNVSWRSKRNPLPCPSLNTPGHLIVEPNRQIARTFRYHGLTVATDHLGRVAEVWIPTDKSP